jgi:hypothetical protein
MALLSFRGISTPSLTAQGEQRRSSYFNIPRDNPLLRTADPLKPGSREANDWAMLSAHITELCDRYARELGENAYAVFNAVTEFASHPPSNRHVHRERNSLQRLAGTWLSSFSQQCRQPAFNLAAYELPGEVH